MKVKSINPGTVFNKSDGWHFQVVINGIPTDVRAKCPSAQAAKQMMRERIARLRKHHGLQ